MPHRDLHRFPLHALFPERFTYTYLPSIQIGLNLPTQPSVLTLTPLLNVDDPATEQPAMPFAQLESAIVRYLLQPHIHLSTEVASLETVTRVLKNSYASFHFTGHAAYNPYRPGNSALALTDSQLTARQISQLDLSSYALICLAACETAVTGKDGIATDYVGLASACLKARAAHVLSTLWPVDESASTWLMIQFYQRLLAGHYPAVALKQAQTWLRSQTQTDLANWIDQLATMPDLGFHWRKELEAQAKILRESQSTMKTNDPPYADPYYWTAFTLTGRGLA